jgi:hypothetical protein
MAQTRAGVRHETARTPKRSTKEASSILHPASMATATFTDGHQQALELDLWILSSTLAHGRSSHQRAIHFQRLQMAKACFVRHRLDAAATDWHDFSTHLRDHCQPSGPLSKRKSVKGKQFKLGGSSVGAVDDPKRSKEPKDGDENVAEPRGPQQQELRGQLKDLQDRLLSGSDEFYSRAFHASAAGMTEMSKGHFLPFLVVTFAALGRLRALLLRLQAKIKLVDIPSMLQMIDGVKNDNDDADVAILQSLRTDLVLLRDSIALVVDPGTAACPSSSSSSEAERHVQLLTNLGITQAAEKLRKGPEETQTTSLFELDKRPSQSHRSDEDIGQKMTQGTAVEDQGAPAVPPSTAAAVGVVQDALDGNAEFLTMVRDKEKNNKKRKEFKKRQHQNGDTTVPLADKKKKKKRAKTKKGDFFDDLFG